MKCEKLNIDETNGIFLNKAEQVASKSDAKPPNVAQFNLEAMSNVRPMLPLPAR